VTEHGSFCRGVGAVPRTPRRRGVGRVHARRTPRRGGPAAARARTRSVGCAAVVCFVLVWMYKRSRLQSRLGWRPARICWFSEYAAICGRARSDWGVRVFDRLRTSPTWAGRPSAMALTPASNSRQTFAGPVIDTALQLPENVKTHTTWPCSRDSPPDLPATHCPKRYRRLRSGASCRSSASRLRNRSEGTRPPGSELGRRRLTHERPFELPGARAHVSDGARSQERPQQAPVREGIAGPAGQDQFRREVLPRTAATRRAQTAQAR